MALTDERRDEILIELNTAVTGIKGTDDNGMVGEIKELHVKLDKLNGQVKTNTTFRKLASWIGSGIGLLVIGTCIKILMTGSIS